jgi:hypothetical protein
MKDGKIMVLNSVVLFGGNAALCPICGKIKDICLTVCDPCYGVLGGDSVVAIATVKKTIEYVVGANKKNDGGDRKRKTLNPRPVFAQVKIGRDAKPKKPDKEGIEDFYEFFESFIMEEEGGSIGEVPIYAFGFEEKDLGGTFPALVSFKIKEVLHHCPANYIRVQKVDSPVELASDVRLYITGSREMTDLFIPELPNIKAINFLYGKGKKKAKKEKDLTYYAGFSRV